MLKSLWGMLMWVSKCFHLEKSQWWKNSLMEFAKCRWKSKNQWEFRWSQYHLEGSQMWKLKSRLNYWTQYGGTHPCIKSKEYSQRLRMRKKIDLGKDKLSPQGIEYHSTQCNSCWYLNMICRINHILYNMSCQPEGICEYHMSSRGY